MLISDSKGRTFGIDDDAVVEDLKVIERELAQREGRPPKFEGLFFIRTKDHPDLAVAKERAFDAAAERFRSRQALRVKPGDWVRINGYRFRIGGVDATSGKVDTQRLSASGSVISSVPIDGVGLMPDESTDPEPDDNLLPPERLKDGHDRARYVLQAHERVLGQLWRG